MALPPHALRAIDEEAGLAALIAAFGLGPEALARVTRSIVNDGPGLAVVESDAIRLWDADTNDVAVVIWPDIAEIDIDGTTLRTVTGDEIVLVDDTQLTKSMPQHLSAGQAVGAAESVEVAAAIAPDRTDSAGPPEVADAVAGRDSVRRPEANVSMTAGLSTQQSSRATDTDGPAGANSELGGAPQPTAAETGEPPTRPSSDTPRPTTDRPSGFVATTPAVPDPATTGHQSPPDADGGAAGDAEGMVSPSSAAIAEAGVARVEASYPYGPPQFSTRIGHRGRSIREANDELRRMHRLLARLGALDADAIERETQTLRAELDQLAARRNRVV